MSDADIEELLKLPPEERLRLVELIWGSLTAIPSTIPLSASHRAAIGEELAEHRFESN
jgi:putative addiction module component (TIGR02574 family)